VHGRISALTVKGRAPFGGLAGRGGFSHGSFAAQVLAGSNLVKTRREGQSRVNSESIVPLDRAW